MYIYTLTYHLIFIHFYLFFISEKDLGFLRIGSLNVRVKKTTEAFSNFLGVGNSGGIAPIDPTLEKVHKSWGSADNVFKVRICFVYFILKT